jgi:hypothetical protein
MTSHISGQCKTEGCDRKQQPGMDGYCPRCFKIHAEKNNIKMLDTMSQLLVKLGEQVSNLSQRVDSLEGNHLPSTPIQKITHDDRRCIISDDTDIFIPKLESDASAEISAKIIENINSKRIDSTVKKLKLIQEP